MSSQGRMMSGCKKRLIHPFITELNSACTDHPLLRGLCFSTSMYIRRESPSAEEITHATSTHRHHYHWQFSSPDLAGNDRAQSSAFPARGGDPERGAG